ncbi:MAG: CRISPR-associated protein Cas5 [Alistipes sp.]|nr:CRISPR-associated protein Cas5 [Alistipes sp.]MBQ9963482.1 CRISPR-associated protein Cas5 [Alistipes sp.]
MDHTDDRAVVIQERCTLDILPPETCVGALACA